MSALTRHRGPLIAGGVVDVAFVNANADQDNNNPLSITGPTGRLAGDLLLALGVSVTGTPTGYTARSNDGAQLLVSRTATADASDNVAWSATGSAPVGAMLAALRTTGTTFVWGTPGSQGGAPLSVTAPSATAVSAGVELLLLSLCQDGGSAAPTFNTPSGFTLLGSVTASGGGEWFRGSVWKRLVTGAGAVGTTNITGSYGSGGAAFNAGAVKVLVSV